MSANSEAVRVEYISERNGKSNETDTYRQEGHIKNFPMDNASISVLELSQ